MKWKGMERRERSYTKFKSSHEVA